MVTSNDLIRLSADYTKALQSHTIAIDVSNLLRFDLAVKVNLRALYHLTCEELFSHMALNNHQVVLAD